MLNSLQSKLLEMMKWLDDYLRKNNIRYYVLGGTLLGAKRHQGFIPWDDDMDIGIPRNDYEKLIKLLEKPVDGYVIESPKNKNNEDFIYQHAKFYDTRTTMIENARIDIKRGVFIDVFPLDGLGNTYSDSIKNYKKINIYNIILASRVSAIRKQRKWYKNLSIILFRLIPSFLLNNRKLCSKIDDLCARRNFDDCKFVGNICGAYGIKEIVPKKYLGKPTEYPFEDMVVFGPEKFEDYLTRIYGDWRQLPPKEKRGIQHDFSNINFNKSYLD